MRNVIQLLLVMASTTTTVTLADGPSTDPLRVAWNDNYLTISGPFPGDTLSVQYLEAYCKPESRVREWSESVISHQSQVISASDDQRSLTLLDKLSDGVTVRHEITAGTDEIDFRLTAHNPNPDRSLAEWAVPCIQVDRFTGCGLADPEATVPEYAKKCFVFLDGKLTRLPTTPWATEARYTPGQAYCPVHVNHDSVDPRPLSELVPSNGLTGCYSGDEKRIMANAWHPYQELSLGVATCIHSDIRIGGLEPGETKQIRGKIYFVGDDIEELVQRYNRDFPEHMSADH